MITDSVVGSWRVLLADEDTAAAQMALDEELARQAYPTLRLFRWTRPAISLGFRQSAPEWAQGERVAVHGIDWVERPTGGGIAVHGSDLSCSVTAPMDHWSLREIMAGVCEALSQGIRACGATVTWQADGEHSRRVAQCLTEESPYAIMAGGRKLCGLAIRRYPESWLVQGSLLVRPIPEVFERVMPPAVWEAFATRAVSLQDAADSAVSDAQVIEQVIRAWETTWNGG